MNKTAYFLLGLIAVLSLTLLISIKATASGKSFPGVVPFSTEGHLGFFDQSNGKIYIYDSNLSRSVFQGQLEDLGKPILSSDENSNKPPIAPSGVPTNEGAL